MPHTSAEATRVRVAHCIVGLAASGKRDANDWLSSLGRMALGLCDPGAAANARWYTLIVVEFLMPWNANVAAPLQQTMLGA